MAAWRGPDPPAVDADGSLAFGISLPRLCAGTLAPSGLLREAANPLGFGAASDVFREDTSLRLDGSASSPARLGVLLMPIADRLGLYLAEGQAGGGEAGIFAVLEPPCGLTVDLLAAAAQPGPAVPRVQDGLSAGDWYGASVAGGVRGVTVARLRAKRRCLSAAVTAGLSSGTRCGPGHFLHAAAAVAGRGVSAAVLFGEADTGWRSLAGRRAAAAVTARGQARVSGRAGAAEAGVSFEAGLPSFDPGCTVPAEWRLTGAVQTGTALGAARQTLRLEADASVRSTISGPRLETAECAISFDDADGGWGARCALAAEATGDDGPQACASWRAAALRAAAVVTPAGSPFSVGVDARMTNRSGGSCLSVRTTLSFERLGGSAWLEAGFEGLGLGPGGSAGTLLLRAGWETVSSLPPSRPPGGPRAPGGTPAAAPPPTPRAR